MKPNGLVIIEKDSLPGRLFDMKLRDFPGIGHNMEANLLERGISTVEQYWNLSPKQARAIWGSVEGEKFWYNLHGFEVPVAEDTNKTVIGHSRVLDTDLRSPAAAKLVARRLVIKAAARLRRAGLYSTNFEVSFRSVDKEGWSTALKISPSQDNFTFLKALDEIWTALIAIHRPRSIKKISISMHGLCKREQITPDLFDTSSNSFQKLQKKNEKLSGVMDTINAKFGSETLMLGVSPQTKAGFVGTKIAFSRIPDVAEFNE
jgi:DNA polymerase-4